MQPFDALETIDRINKKYSKFLDYPYIDVNKNVLVSHSLVSEDVTSALPENYIVCQWHTSTFKSQDPEYNSYRSSKNHDVIKAIDYVSSNLKVHIVILNKIEDLNTQRQILINPFLHAPFITNNVTGRDYLEILAKAKMFLSGTSGAHLAGCMLFKIPTLNFDYPIFFPPVPFDYFCVSHSSLKSPLNNKTNTSKMHLASTVPHNGFKIRALGYVTQTQTWQELAANMQEFILKESSIQ